MIVIPQSTVRLSVVVASYNRASFLPGCVASLRAAGVPDLEIIIVDDGSKDDTRAVVESLGPGIRYIYHENRGLSAARNTGILAATGRYIAYLDSDDFWLPGVAQSLLEFLDRHPDIGAVFTDADMGNPQEGYTSWAHTGGKSAFLDFPFLTEVEPGFNVLESIPFWRFLLHYNIIFTGAIVQRRELVIASGMFDPCLKSTGDWEMWMRMVHLAKFAFCPQKLAVYIRHADNMTNDADRMHKAYCDSLSVHAGRGLRLGKPERELLRRALQAQWFDYGYKAYDRHDYTVARRRFAEALKDHGWAWRTFLFWMICALPRPLPRLLRRAKQAVTGGHAADSLHSTVNQMYLL
jgi:glycosyltransferase involved in cell wall biosynthesis